MQKAAMAQEALSPFADRTDVYQSVRQVEAAVRVMEAALPFAYEDSKVRHHTWNSTWGLHRRHVLF